MSRMRLSSVLAAMLASAVATLPALAQTMIVGNDEKLGYDNGKAVQHEPGHDTLSIIDMSQPATLRMIATIPLDNTIIGPPTNLAVAPSGAIALVANSPKAEKDGAGWKSVPDDRLFVIDLKANPPKVVATV